METGINSIIDSRFGTHSQQFSLFCIHWYILIKKEARCPKFVDTGNRCHGSWLKKEKWQPN